MRKIYIGIVAFSLFVFISACSKDSNNPSNSDKTVANISGSYGLTSLVFSLGSLSVNYYDSLEPCEKDNVIKLESTMAASFIDAGVQCVPPEDSTGTWSLTTNGDSLYLISGAEKQAFLIKTFDGTQLVLQGSDEISGLPVTSTTTLKKK